MQRAMSLLFMSFVGCVTGEVYTGTRCPPDQAGCLDAPDDAGALDGSDFWSTDAARTRPCLCADGGVGARSDEQSPCQSCVAVPSAGPPSRCVAGRYEGSFDMSYRSGPGGVCGLIAELRTAQAAGGWAFALAGPVPPGALTLHIESACVRAGAGATADGRTITPPLRMTLTGNLDCSTGMLNAELRGTYSSASVCDLGAGSGNYFFKGSVSGRYDPVSSTFAEGKVRWEEPPVLFPPAPGGEGIWAASLVPDVGAKDDLVGDCLAGVSFPEERFVDAGP